MKLNIFKFNVGMFLAFGIVILNLTCDAYAVGNIVSTEDKVEQIGPGMELLKEDNKTESSSETQQEEIVASSFNEEEVKRIQHQMPLDDSSVGKAVMFADSKIDCKYSQSQRSSGRAYDCSSLIYYSYLNGGINLAYKGYNIAASIAKGLVDSGKEVQVSDLQKGDLIFYAGKGNGRYLNINHVAMYLGNGYMVEASESSGRVKYSPLRLENMVKICRPDLAYSIKRDNR